MLANNLKSLRRLKKLTQKQVATALNMNALQTYQAYEDGRSEPPIKILIKIADFYEITLDRLLRDDMQEEWDLQEFERLKKKLKKK